MLKLKNRLRAAVCIGLLYLAGGSIRTLRVEIRRLLVGNPQPFGSVAYGSPANSKLSAGLGDRQINASDDHSAIVCTVPLLGFPISPSAIAGFVAPFAADSIQRQAGRGLSHIGEEIVERVQPSVTDRDAAGTVKPKLLGFRIVAALLHAAPAIVGARILRAASMSMRPLIPNRHLAGQATARFGVAASKLVIFDHDLNAARTTA